MAFLPYDPSLDREMEIQLSCSVCLELFTEPVLLPCLHSLCRNCVELLTKQGETTTFKFKCPECNVLVQLGVGGCRSLKKNFPLNNMVAIYKQGTLKRQMSTMSTGLATLPQVDEEPNVSRVANDQGQDLNGNLTVQNAASGQQTTVQPTLTTFKPTQTTGQPAQTRVQPAQTTVQPAQTAVQPAQTTVQPAQTTVQSVQIQPAQPPQQPNASGSQTSVTQTPTTCSTCEVSTPRKADVHCVDCTLSFCTYCFDSFHPEGMGHRLQPVKDQQAQTQPQEEENKQCPVCDPSSPSPPTVQCLECQMSFCDQCLMRYHPTTKTEPGHTLVYMTTTTTTRGPEGEVAGAGGTAARAPGVTGADASEKRQSGGNVSTQSNSSIDALSSNMDVGGLVHLTGTFLCSKCAGTQQRTAAFKCLDCSYYFCEGCVRAHQGDRPSHTLLDIRLEQQLDQKIKAGTNQNAAQPKKEPINVQLKLVELMNVQANTMAELMKVLQERRAQLDKQLL